MNENIFIAIPAFNEKFTHITVEDAFAKADNPENVYIGIDVREILKAQETILSLKIFPGTRTLDVST